MGILFTVFYLTLMALATSGGAHIVDHARAVFDRSAIPLVNAEDSQRALTASRSESAESTSVVAFAKSQLAGFRSFILKYNPRRLAINFGIVALAFFAVFQLGDIILNRHHCITRVLPNAVASLGITTASAILFFPAEFIRSQLPSFASWSYEIRALIAAIVVTAIIFSTPRHYWQHIKSAVQKLLYSDASQAFEKITPEANIKALQPSKNQADVAKITASLTGEATMQLRLRRSQRSGGILGGKLLFTLDARAELSPEEKALVQKYGLGKSVVYDSEARKKHAASAYGQFDDATAMSGYSMSAAGRSLWANARGIASAAMMSMSLRVTIDSLMAGQHIECKDLDELLGAEGAILNACKNIKAYLDTAQTFDGREEIVEF